MKSAYLKNLLLCASVFGVTFFACSKLIPEMSASVVTGFDYCSGQYTLSLENNSTLVLSELSDSVLYREKDGESTEVDYHEFLADLKKCKVAIAKNFFGSYTYTVAEDEDPQCSTVVEPDIYLSEDGREVVINPKGLFPRQLRVWVSNDYSSIVLSKDNADGDNSDFKSIVLCGLTSTIPVTSKTAGEQLVTLLKANLDSLYTPTPIESLEGTVDKVDDAEYVFSNDDPSLVVSTDCTGGD